MLIFLHMMFMDYNLHKLSAIGIHIVAIASDLLLLMPHILTQQSNPSAQCLPQSTPQIQCNLNQNTGTVLHRP